MGSSIIDACRLCDTIKIALINEAIRLALGEILDLSISRCDPKRNNRLSSGPWELEVMIGLGTTHHTATIVFLVLNLQA